MSTLVEKIVCQVALDLRFITIYWYGIMMALAFVLGITVCIRLGRAYGMNSAFMSDLGCWIMVAGVVGARAAHVLGDIRAYLADPLSILYIHKGGLVFYGGFIGAVLGIYLFARRHHKNPLRLFDIVVVALPLSHAIGRLGCFINGCCFGKLCGGITGVRYPLASLVGWTQYLEGQVPHDAVRRVMGHAYENALLMDELPDRLSQLVESGEAVAHDIAALPVHPVQLYEAGLNVLLFVLLFRLFHRLCRPGSVSAVYAMTYGAIRFSVEFVRGDPRLMVGALTSAQATSVAMIGVGIIGLIWVRTRGTEDNAHSPGG